MGSSQPNRVTGAMSSFFADWSGDNRDRAAAPYARPDLRPIETPRRGSRLRRGTVAGIAVLAAATASIVVPMAGASADPSAHTWYRLRMCESSDNYSTDTGNAHYGAYQFDLSTWRSVGGSGYPSRASKAEQDKRALILYRERGWQPWQCARILGLRDDSDARSGRIGDLRGTSSSHSSSGVPGFPGGSHWYVYGDNSSHIKTFQNEMHHRGYFPAGTGQYGPKTERMVKQLQKLNGLAPTGQIGPNTWRLAWKGKFSAPGTAAPKPAHAATGAPAFPGGSHWYFYGDNNANIKAFQNEMHHRGYFPAGTGEYGWKTWYMVTQLQRLNGLVPNGLIGPNTWRLAWTGKYHAR